MDTKDDPFDLDNLRLTSEEVAAAMDRVAAKQPKVQPKRSREPFVKVPLAWIERLKEARHMATYRLALHILYWSWKGGGKPFTLSNSVAAAAGVQRGTKWRGLRELEQLGLIMVERRKRKSPKVTILNSRDK